MIYTYIFFQPHLQHIEIPSLGVKLELQLQTASQPQQHQILNPLRETRNQTRILIKTTLGP